MVTLATLWTTSLFCLLMNSTWEFLKWEEKVCLQSLIIASKLDASKLFLLTMSTTGCLESNSNTTLLSCKSLTYFIAWKSPNDSPISAPRIGEIYSVFASTNWPIILYTHANTHFTARSRKRGVNFAFISSYRRSCPSCIMLTHVLVIAIVTRILFISSPVNNDILRSHTTTLVAVSFPQITSYSFLPYCPYNASKHSFVVCTQSLHNIKDIISHKGTMIQDLKHKIPKTSLYQYWILLCHEKNKCILSSTPVSQRTQLFGPLTPRS